MGTPHIMDLWMDVPVQTIHLEAPRYVVFYDRIPTQKPIHFFFAGNRQPFVIAVTSDSTVLCRCNRHESHHILEKKHTQGVNVSLSI